jgi:hypothetical protein
MLVSVSIAGAVGYVIFNQLLQVVNELPSYRENINNKLKTLRAPHKGALGRAAENVKELGKGKELTPPKEATASSRPRRLTGFSYAQRRKAPTSKTRPVPTKEMALLCTVN